MTNVEFDVRGDKNRSYTYILPLTGVSIGEYKNLLQCFVGDKNKPELKNKIFLLTEKSKEAWFEYYDKTIQDHLLYETEYDCDDYHKMYVFDIPEKYRKNYFKFLNGQYSQFDDAYKRHVLSFHGITNRSEVGKVLYRAESKYKEWEKKLDITIDRGQEIGSMPIMKEEIYCDAMKVFKEKNSVDGERSTSAQ